MNRLLQPLLKINGQHQPISFEEAFRQIHDHCTWADENNTLVMSSCDYSNEELYLLQKIARTVLKTNAVGTFDYYRRGTAFFIDKNDIVPFTELCASSLFICIFDESAETESLRFVKKLIDTFEDTPRYLFNTANTLHITDYAAFFRSLNRYLIHENLATGIYVEGLGKNYEAYKKQILNDDYQKLLDINNLKNKEIETFIQLLLHTKTPVFLVWERLLDERGIIELENLCMLLDIQAKPASGFLSIKAELNSQGAFDMGMFPECGVGGRPMNEETTRLMTEIFNKNVVATPVNLAQRLSEQSFSHCLLFNSTGAHIPEEIQQQVRHCNFSLLQTAFWNSSCDDFNLILPASLPDEVIGTFTDCTHTAHSSKPATTCPIEYNTLRQISAIGNLFGLEADEDPTSIFLEYISFFHGGCRSSFRHFFR